MTTGGMHRCKGVPPKTRKVGPGHASSAKVWQPLPKEEMNQVDRAGDLPGPVVFTNVPEYSLVDDLSGEPLPPPLVTLAKREEVTEIYRRERWIERSVEDCFRDTGKPPIRERWDVANKRDGLHPNVRCRLVAKHLAAKYGGKDMEDLFAAMPPLRDVEGTPGESDSKAR